MSKWHHQYVTFNCPGILCGCYWVYASSPWCKMFVKHLLFLIWQFLVYYEAQAEEEEDQASFRSVRIVLLDLFVSCISLGLAGSCTVLSCYPVSHSRFMLMIHTSSHFCQLPSIYLSVRFSVLLSGHLTLLLLPWRFSFSFHVSVYLLSVLLPSLGLHHQHKM